MCALFAEINRPTNEMEFDASLAYTGETPIVQNQWMHSRSSYAVVPPSKPTYKHDRLHSNEWVEAPREIGNGRDLMALFDNETVPRTQYELLVRHQDQQDNTALAIIEARMTLKEICEDYPKFATSSSLLLVFLCEGWTPRMIWNNISAECRQSSPDDCPWGYIDEALQYEIDLLAAAEAEPGVDAEERVSETNETSTPAAEARGRKAPNWTAADDTTLSDLRSQGKTHKHIGLMLGRSATACASRLNKLKKAQEAAAADNSGQAAGTASDPWEIEDITTPGGQIDDPIVLDD